MKPTHYRKHDGTRLAVISVKFDIDAEMLMRAALYIPCRPEEATREKLVKHLRSEIRYGESFIRSDFWDEVEEADAYMAEALARRLFPEFFLKVDVNTGKVIREEKRV
jgi:hypothetical protein